MDKAPDTEGQKLVNQITDLLMENGCSVTQPAMFELAIFILEREKQAIRSVFNN